MTWFRNLPSGVAFGTVDSSCNFTPPQAGDVALDFSLQTAVAFAVVADGRYTNPCKSAPASAPAPTPAAASASAPTASSAPRKIHEVQR
jgi:hypothetical protein